MVEIVLVSIVALFASMLTLFSGFGLGTLLMPVVVVFFPIEQAIAITAMVHLANNFFKVWLLGKQADRAVLLRFGLTAILFAFIGAFVLATIVDLPPLLEYQLFNQVRQLVPIKLIVGVLIIAFVLLELWPAFAAINLPKKYLPFGGALSGFFGGLSGHQGAFRSMFLLKAGLTKQEFIATGVLVAVMVDVSRMTVYGVDFATQQAPIAWPLVISASLFAFLGAFLGNRMLKKITFATVQVIVSALLVLIGVGLIGGLL